MTAEVAILNRSAVALAADSAMTFGQPGDEKIYHANKVFTLSKFHPVGVMIYNNASYMSVPFETIIKMYRTKAWDKSEPTIPDYSGNFLRWLTEEQYCTPSQVQKNVENILTDLFQKVRRHANDAIQTEFNKTLKVPKQKISALIRSNIDQAIDKLESRDDCVSLNNIKNSRAIVSRYEKQFETALSGAFLGMKITLSNKIALKRLARLALTKDYLSDLYTGIVIAGFGEDEMFPTLRAVEIDGIIDGELKYRVKSEIDISRDRTTAAIRAFAQREMVDRFMTGIDPDLQIYIAVLLSNLMKEFGKEIVDSYVSETRVRKNQIRRDVRARSDSFVDKFMNKSLATQQQEFIGPIVDAVANMPKDELAHMAEALVNLTSVKRRVSVEPETVGGPVDVAVISKGDGLVWIKRKHYFEMELNRDFMHKYYTRGK
jgi:hypothetical protein